MKKSKSIASCYKNGYLKTLNNEADVKTAVKDFIEKSKNINEPQEMVILNSPTSGVKVVRSIAGKITTELVNF